MGHGDKSSHQDTSLRIKPVGGGGTAKEIQRQSWGHPSSGSVAVYI